jgi:hypothetical protein
VVFRFHVKPEFATCSYSLAVLPIDETFIQMWLYFLEQCVARREKEYSLLYLWSRAMWRNHGFFRCTADVSKKDAIKASSLLLQRSGVVRRALSFALLKCVLQTPDENM